jgi:hypothetical protein
MLCVLASLQHAPGIWILASDPDPDPALHVACCMYVPPCVCVCSGIWCVV